MTALTKVAKVVWVKVSVKLHEGVQGCHSNGGGRAGDGCHGDGVGVGVQGLNGDGFDENGKVCHGKGVGEGVQGCHSNGGGRAGNGCLDLTLPMKVTVVAMVKVWVKVAVAS